MKKGEIKSEKDLVRGKRSKIEGSHFPIRGGESTIMEGPREGERRNLPG